MSIRSSDTADADGRSCSAGSAIISFHWLTQPTVRDSAKIGVNIEVGKPIASRMMPE